jgi:hypothetical protein
MVQLDRSSLRVSQGPGESLGVAMDDTIPGAQHLPERHAAVQVCSQEGMLDEDMAWCMRLKGGSSYG